MENLIKWEDLSIERCSMLNIINGKFIKAHDAYKQDFMLAYGKTRFNNYKTFIILMDGTFKEYACSNEKECDETAFSIIKYLIVTKDTIMRFFEESGDAQ
jgi:hypothetical protein